MTQSNHPASAPKAWLNTQARHGVQRLLENRLLNRSVEKVFKNSPDARDWIYRQKWKIRLALGERLVPEEALSHKYRDALLWLADEESRQAIGDYLEFGVFNGTSLACMHRVLRELGFSQVRLFGFDSFEGLPASAAMDGWRPGSYKMDYEYTHKWLSRRKVDWGRVLLIKGWFHDTLNQSCIDRHNIKKASVIMMDCDAYSSAKEALEFCAPLIHERCVILFDDWNSKGRAERNIGEKQALDEFLAVHPEFSVMDFGSYAANSQVFKLYRRAHPSSEFGSTW